MLDAQTKLFHVEGLSHIIESAGSLGGKSRPGGIDTGQHNHLAIGMDGFDLLEHTEAIGAGHHDIQQHRIRLILANLLNRFVG